MPIQHPIVVGVDPHADTLSAAAVDSNGTLLWEATVANTTGAINKLLEIHPPDGQLWAIEGTGSFGRQLTNQLLTRGVTVREVPTRLTARLRSRNGFSKTDPIDAVTIARSAHTETLPIPKRHPVTEALRVLIGQREALVNAQVRASNRLTARLRELPPDQNPIQGRIRNRHQYDTLTRLAATDPDPHHQAVITAIRIDASNSLHRRQQITGLTTSIRRLLPEAGTALMGICGIGIIGAATIIAHTGDITRFPTDGHYARYCGTAPIDASSGRNQRQRLNRWGNRTLNRVTHIAIITQLSQHDQAHHYITRRLTEGKTKNEAIRAAKRHLTRRIYRTLQQHPLT